MLHSNPCDGLKLIYESSRKSQNEVSSLDLHSSSALGSGKLQTNANRLARDEDKTVRRALDGGNGPRKRRRIVGTEDAEDEDDQDMEVDELPSPQLSSSKGLLAPRIKPTPAPALPDPTSTSPEISLPVPSPAPAQPKVPVAIGGALKRNADGTIIAPKIVVRKPKVKRTVSQFIA